MRGKRSAIGIDRGILCFLIVCLAVMGISAAQASGSVKQEMKTVNGIQLSVKEAGSGPDMVLVHGRGFRKEGMDAFFERYQTGWHVISYDVRCHGNSEDTDAFTLDDCANDLAALVEIYGLEHPVVIGFSMGSYISLLTAEKHPDLFSRLVLIGTKGREKVSGERLASEPDKVRRALLDYDLFPEMDKITVPALVMTGENDATNPPEKGRAVAEALPDASFEVIPNAEHIAWFGNGQRVFSLVDAFLERE